jgi:membrane-associated phospholipid phosphatase
MRHLSTIGEPAVVILIGLAGFLSALQYGHRHVQLAFIYAGIAFGLNTLIKLLLRRRRPYGLVVETLGVRSYSFPSGHAFGTMIFYGLFAYLDNIRSI